MNRQGQTRITVPNANLTPAQRVTLDRLARELRLTDQILADDLDTLNVDFYGPAPAWTSLEGDCITFALDRMPMPTSPLSVAVWLGTNAHELGHVLFSPRRESLLMARVIEGDTFHLRGIANLANICEDQRQERLLLARFAPWRAYLVAALGHHLKYEDASAWVLLAGRTWLPADLRDEAHRRFAKAYGRASADEVTHLVGDYQRLLDPGDSEADEAWEILLRLHELFGTTQPPVGSRCQVIEGGEPDTTDPGEDAPAAADEPAEDDEDEGGQEASSPAESKKPHRPRALKDRITKAAQAQLTAEQDVAEDLAGILESLRSGHGAGTVEGEDAPGRHQPVTDRAWRLHREVTEALVDLRDESEPGWVKRTGSGRLSARRLAAGSDPEQLFDRYEPGAMETTDLELVLLLDVSGSMATAAEELGEVTWAIRWAVEDIEGAATVITWDSGPHRILASPGERPDERVFVPKVLGGTRPASALAEAYRLLSGSQSRNRLMVIVTDGFWADLENPEQIVGAMNDEGITTVCALLGNEVDLTDLHQCQHGGPIAEPAALGAMFRDVALAQMTMARY
jgi:hypothetical protein